MALTTALIEVLKRELKSRDINYAGVAKKLDLSETSIKRMFSAKDFMQSRLDKLKITEKTRAQTKRARKPEPACAHCLAPPGDLLERFALDRRTLAWAGLRGSARVRFKVM